MRQVATRLKCGCRGYQQFAWNYVGVHFMTTDPCPSHPLGAGRWRDVSEVDVEWFDEEELARHQHEIGLLTQWQGERDAAITAGREPESFRDFVFRQYKAHPEWLDEEDRDLFLSDE